MSHRFHEIYFWSKIAVSLWILIYFLLSWHYFRQFEHQIHDVEFGTQWLPIWRPYCVGAWKLSEAGERVVSLCECRDVHGNRHVPEFDEQYDAPEDQNEEFVLELRFLNDIVDLEIGPDAVCGLRKVQKGARGGHGHRRELLGMRYFIFAKTLSAPRYFEKESDFIEACKLYGLSGRNRRAFADIYKPFALREAANDTVVNYCKEVVLHPPTRCEYGVACFWFLLWSVFAAIGLCRHRAHGRKLQVEIEEY